MAWIVFALDGTLLDQQEMDDGTGTGATTQLSLPTEGAVEAVMQLMNEGNRVSVWTDRFAPMPEERKQQLKEEIEMELQEAGFPPLEVWTGTTKPAADVYVDRKAVTYDDDWGLALAMIQQQMEDQGLLPAMQAGMDDGSGMMEPEALEGGVPEEEEQPAVQPKKPEKKPEAKKKVIKK
jgi:hypothetical protein